MTGMRKIVKESMQGIGGYTIKALSAFVTVKKIVKGTRFGGIKTGKMFDKQAGIIIPRIQKRLRSSVKYDEKNALKNSA